MSIEEKAKAYEMALEAARKELGVDRKEWEVVQRVLHNIFPELRESEDERIRKEIISLVLKVMGQEKDNISDDKYGAMLSWLEKQKEQKQTDLPAGFYYIDLDGNKYYSKEFRYGDMKVKVGEQKPMEYGDDIVEDAEEYTSKVDCGEYGVEVTEAYIAGALRERSKKPAEKQDYSGLNDLERAILRGFLCAGVENVPVGIIKDTAAECIGFLALIEPKPVEWSEEDERIRKALVWHLKADVDFVSNGVTKAECLAYLDKQKAQKQEWNEEDEKVVKSIINYLSYDGTQAILTEEIDEWISWLKSLRPQWKPSEEQMEALNAMNCCGELSYQGQQQLLIDLYQQLKKLM